MTVTVAAARTSRHTPTAEFPAYLAHGRAVGTVARVVGVILTLVIVFTALVVDTPALSPMPTPSSSLASLFAAPLVILVLVFGDRRWPAPTGAVRTASLAARRLRDTVPTAELALAAIATVALWVGSAFNPDATIGERVTSDAISLLAVALAVLAIRRVTTRASLVGVDGATDLAFRGLTYGRVMRALAVGFFLAAAGIQPLVVDGPGNSPGVVGTLLFAGALIGLFGLQGRRPRASVSTQGAPAERIA
ncbi:MAG: hypothetical protein WKF57_05160 [Nakamurella sp.]